MINEELMEKALNIDDSSIFKLSEELRKHPRREFEAHRLSAEAIKKVDMLETEMEITVAEIVEDICNEAIDNGRPIPPSSRSEIRRSKAPLDKRFRKIRDKWARAKETSNILSGWVKSFSSRGYSLSELGRIAEKQLSSDPVVYNKTNTKRTETKLRETEDNLEY